MLVADFRLFSYRPLPTLGALASGHYSALTTIVDALAEKLQPHSKSDA